MAIKFSKESSDRILTVHPDLRAVLYHAAELATSAEDFKVLEGVRTRKQMMINYGKGRTVAQCVAKGVYAEYAQPKLAKVTWLNDPFKSNHRAMSDGFGRAVDLAPWPIDFKDIRRYKALYELIMRAAADLKIKVRSGIDWDSDGILMEKGETDLGHYELVL